MHGVDSVCLSDEAGPNHIYSLLKSKYAAKELGTLGFEDSVWMQREYQDSEYTTRESTRHVGVRQKKESSLEERRFNTIPISEQETVLFGPR